MSLFDLISLISVATCQKREHRTALGCAKPRMHLCGCRSRHCHRTSACVKRFHTIISSIIFQFVSFFWSYFISHFRWNISRIRLTIAMGAVVHHTVPTLVFINVPIDDDKNEISKTFSSKSSRSERHALINTYISYLIFKAYALLLHA